MEGSTDLKPIPKLRRKLVENVQRSCTKIVCHEEAEFGAVEMDGMEEEAEAVEVTFRLINVAMTLVTEVVNEAMV
jgi:hypothetical protein